MSSGTQSMRRRIAGAGDLKAVVQSMKALAASSIGQYERAVRALDDYYRTVELGMAACLRGVPDSIADDPVGAPTSLDAVIFGSDQGLVGRFNDVLVEFATREIAAVSARSVSVWAVGDRIHSLLEDRPVEQPEPFAVPSSIEGIAPLVGDILVKLGAKRDRGKLGQVYVFHNHPEAGSVYAPVGRRLLPLDRAWLHKIARLPWPTQTLPEVIEGTGPTLRAFVRAFLFVSLYQACAESLASENASRLAAMQRAERNIEDMLDDLNRAFHRARQEAIDEELFDVLSGFEAVAHDSPPHGDTTAD